MSEPVASRLTILIVDDSRLMRVAARKILKAEFEILEAEDGEQAWKTLQNEPHIGLVMSDLSMPNLDGLGLLQRVRQAEQPDIRTIPVIIVTGADDDDGSKQTALAAGASDFITKPFEAIELLARIKAQARQQQTQQALRSSETIQQQLERHSTVDLLTGLSNERHFGDRLEADLSYARRHDTGFALLLVKVDKYKVIFLRRGKETAEEILRHVARLLGTSRRAEDLVARIDLDTFAVALPSTAADGAGGVAKRLLDAVRAQAFDVRGERIPASVSIAVTSRPPGSETRAAQLMETAAQHLHEAVAAGGNCISPRGPADSATAATVVAPREPTVYAPMQPAVASISDVERALHAIANGRQPDSHTTSLVLAVLPLLQAWNRTHNNRHAGLIEALETALGRRKTTTQVPVDAV